MPFSLPPIPPPSPSPHLSVQLQPTLISTVSLQREPFKGQGGMAAAATKPPTQDLSKSKERVKKASAGRTSHYRVLWKVRAIKSGDPLLC